MNTMQCMLTAIACILMFAAGAVIMKGTVA